MTWCDRSLAWPAQLDQERLERLLADQEVRADRPRRDAVAGAERAGEGGVVAEAPACGDAVDGQVGEPGIGQVAPRAFEPLVADGGGDGEVLCSRTTGAGS